MGQQKLVWNADAWSKSQRQFLANEFKSPSFKMKFDHNLLPNYHQEPVSTVSFSWTHRDSDTKQRGFPVHSSMSETWCLCEKNAAHVRCLQVVRARGRGVRVRRTPRQPQDKQERHLWVEAIISHPTEIIPSAVCRWSTRCGVLRPWPARKKTKPSFIIGLFNLH